MDANTKSILQQLISWAGVLLLALIMSGACAGCTSSRPTPAYRFKPAPAYRPGPKPYVHERYPNHP